MKILRWLRWLPVISIKILRWLPAISIKILRWLPIISITTWRGTKHHISNLAQLLQTQKLAQKVLQMINNA